MTIETNEERERARVALERRSPHVLAAFILSLIDAPNGIGNHVHIFAVADDPKAAADLLGARLLFCKKGNVITMFVVGGGQNQEIVRTRVPPKPARSCCADLLR